MFCKLKTQTSAKFQKQKGYFPKTCKVKWSCIRTIATDVHFQDTNVDTSQHSCTHTGALDTKTHNTASSDKREAEFAYWQTDIYSSKVNADKMSCIIRVCNQRMVIKAIWMGTGLFHRRLFGTTHDTKDVSKTTDTQYSAVQLYSTYCYRLCSQRALI